MILLKAIIELFTGRVQKFQNQTRHGRRSSKGFGGGAKLLPQK